MSDPIPPTTCICVIYASQTGAKLDSNVISGGGTDDTEVLQAVLDRAEELGGLHLVMDGTALVRGLHIHSNTTIECLNQSCGFFLAAQSNCSIVQNAHLDFKVRHDRNISLIGGTYNHNCPEQVHHVTREASERWITDRWVIGLEFYGVENLLLRDVTIRNQRTFGILVANWYRVHMENITIDLPDRVHAENQDGIHFWGPGQFLTMRNIQGCAGDDFLALAPDENDLVSSITDVLIDGVFLSDADQGIRLLSRAEGRLDRVVIRNVTGSYRSFGFYINPWFPGTGGNYGNIVIDTVDLRHTDPDYTYTTPFLFRIGGKHECLTLRNIYHHQPWDGRAVIEIDRPFYVEEENGPVTDITSLVIDGLHIQEDSDRAADARYITIGDKVRMLVLRDVEVIRSEDVPQQGYLIETKEGAEVSTLILNGVNVNRMRSLVNHQKGKFRVIQANNIMCSDMGGDVLQIGDGTITGIIGTLSE
jgi:hypothetical protein